MTGIRMCRGAHVINIFGEESLPDGAARSWDASGRSVHRTPICDARFPHSVISVAVYNDSIIIFTHAGQVL